MKKRILGLVTLSLIANLAMAEEPQPTSKVVVYISPQEYTNQIKLWHFVKDYWFAQGPLVAPVLTQTLSAKLGKTVMCDAGVTGDVLLWVRPQMFYNPHMRNFYGTIKATVYTGAGKAIAHYTGESRYSGDLDILPAKTIQATYDLAIQHVADKIQADPVVRQLISEGVSSKEGYTPCAMIALLPGRIQP
ncbi:hypothetical protein SAMN05192560_0928 [Methylobacillus rhizosphaerae]|uniref:DUF4136 domain-containing protein n=1 Tax=Methylobacillus rhizosphaerae TaxID=551994 RepID=A0A238YXZ5_9PROT|nr:hypothetical protein [Methylobacillus rhizosphaerae]SNR75957.1 hypothetical protein SAMN05192560_0928 [Methylobacillus rhizosphaerae]